MQHFMAISQTKLGDGWTIEGAILGIVILVVIIVAARWVLGKIFGGRS